MTLSSGLATMSLNVWLAVEDATFWMPKAASEQAAQVDWLYYFIYWLCLFTFIGVVAVGAYFAWRYRRSAVDGPEPSPSHNLPLELGWSLPPLLLVVLIFWWGFQGFMAMNVPPADAYKIEVIGKKWSWMFRYPNGAETTELLVPPNEPVMLIMQSEDVLHSFFVPEFRVKRDLVPGRYSTVWFTANEPGGRHRLFCTEYCGDEHSSMKTWVEVAEDREDFDTRIKILADIYVDPETGEPIPQAEWGERLGEKLYNLRGCASCHNYEVEAIKVGPSFLNLYGDEAHEVIVGGSRETITADEDYLRESILQPNAKIAASVPQGGMQLIDMDDRDLTTLVDFIMLQSEQGRADHAAKYADSEETE